MNEITNSKLMDMSATIVAGMMANPANGATEMNSYNLSNTLSNVIQAVTGGLNAVGIQVVGDE